MQPRNESARGWRLIALAGCAAAVVLAAASDALAWYFPEHVVIAHDGVMQLPDAVRGVLESAVARARARGVGSDGGAGAHGWVRDAPVIRSP